MKNREVTALQIPFSIYQVKSTDDARGLRFAHYEEAEKDGTAISVQNYDLVYSSALDELPLDINKILESIYQQFNYCRPADFTGHSISTSDVIVVQDNGEQRAFYCDFIGFREIPDFLKNDEVQTA